MIVNEDSLRSLLVLLTTPNKPIEREISLGNQVTLRKSKLISMFLTTCSSNVCERCSCSLKAK